MPKLINCARCGEITPTEIINGRHTINCKECRELHNNKAKQNKSKEDETPQEETPQEEEETRAVIEVNLKEPITQELLTEETQEPITENKSIKYLLQEIINNIKSLTEINKLQYENTTDILNNVNNKLDNTINNINNTTSEINNDNNLNEFIKKQQIQNKIITNKLDNLIKAIT